MNMANAIVGIVGSQVQGDKVLPGSIWVFSSPSINLDPPPSKKSRDPLSNSDIVCDPPEPTAQSRTPGILIEAAYKGDFVNLISKK